MGRPKVWLAFGPERMLQRVVRIVGEAVGPVLVVAARGQELPRLAIDVEVILDRQPNRGPLEGIAVGLSAIAGRADAAFVTACDVPLLRPEWIRRIVELSVGYDVAVPHVGGLDQPLSAVYRTSVQCHADALLAEGRARPAFLFDMVRTRRIAPEELADVDPDLESLWNVNNPQDLAAALARARQLGS
jgi:molybdopterin-guanine dinucleotide biosynthesis protein A